MVTRGQVANSRCIRAASACHRLPCLGELQRRGPSALDQHALDEQQQEDRGGQRATARCGASQSAGVPALPVPDGATVTITERTYAHLKPDAYEADYGRVAFLMPTTGNVVELSAAR